MFFPPFALPTSPRSDRAACAPRGAHEAASSAQGAPEATPVTIDGLHGPTELRPAAGGYWQVWPRPTVESQRALYGEKFYAEDKATYLDDVTRDRPYWDAIWSIRRGMLEAALPKRAADQPQILDVGCSGGFLLDHFEQHGWRGFGIEPSRQAARHARERFGLEVFCGGLLDFDLDADREFRAEGGALFDAIHCAQVLEHVLDPDACVARMAELLTSGGVVFVEVPNDFNVLQETARAKLGKAAWWVAPDHHLNYFDAASLSALLARHGLEEVDRVASFPIEMFLLMGEDYVGRPEVGRVCHDRRMAFERALIEAGRIEELAELYRALARAEIGRTCGLLARKRR
ncbi:class I SAM-dependent methyltransferase [Myxococcota bacterium]|nr:class I SAM-dependent methyltransferase [Myxococcota bacterium]